MISFTNIDMSKRRIDQYNDALRGRWGFQWWYSDEYIQIIKDIVDDKLFLWEDVADRQEALKLIAVGGKNYAQAQLHKDLRDYAQQSWHMNPLDQTDEWWTNQSACVRLLCDIEEGRVDWSEIFVEQHNLMIQAGEQDELDAAMFHKKLKQYAEEVFINDDKTGIRIPGQAGEE